MIFDLENLMGHCPFLVIALSTPWSCWQLPELHVWYPKKVVVSSTTATLNRLPQRQSTLTGIFVYIRDTSRLNNCHNPFESDPKRDVKPSARWESVLSSMVESISLFSSSQDLCTSAQLRGAKWTTDFAPKRCARQRRKACENCPTTVVTGNELYTSCNKGLFLGWTCCWKQRVFWHTMTHLCLWFCWRTLHTCTLDPFGKERNSAGYYANKQGTVPVSPSTSNLTCRSSFVVEYKWRLRRCKTNIYIHMSERERGADLDLGPM